VFSESVFYYLSELNSNREFNLSNAAPRHCLESSKQCRGGDENRHRFQTLPTSDVSNLSPLIYESLFRQNDNTLNNIQTKQNNGGQPYTVATM